MFVVGKKKHTQKAVSNAIFESSLKINHMEYRNLLLPYKVKYKPKTFQMKYSQNCPNSHLFKVTTCP